MQKINNRDLSHFHIAENLLINREYNINTDNATPLQFCQYIVYCLQCLSAKCYTDRKEVLLFPKIVRDHTHAEYLSAMYCKGLVWAHQHNPNAIRYKDNCGNIQLIGHISNAEGSVLEALIYSANCMVIDWTVNT